MRNEEGGVQVFTESLCVPGGAVSDGWLFVFRAESSSGLQGEGRRAASFTALGCSQGELGFCL